MLISPAAGAAAGIKTTITATYHTLALQRDGSLWAWGWNNQGQLGLGNTNEQWCPTLVGTGYVAVAAGFHHSLGLKADGSLWAWGRNAYGQLGLGDTTDRRNPVPVKGFNAPRGVVIPLY